MTFYRSSDWLFALELLMSFFERDGRKALVEATGHVMRVEFKRNNLFF